MSSRISTLAAGTVLDYVEGLDVADTSMAGTGTNKKYPPATLLTQGLAGNSNVLPLTAIANPGSPAAGQVWQSTDQGTLEFLSAGLPCAAGGIVWQGLSAGTAIANTTTQTSALAGISTTIGSLTFPAGSLTAGKIIVPQFFGTWGATGTPTLLVQLLLGGVVIGGSAATAQTAQTGNSWSIENVTGPGGWQVQSVGASGKIRGMARCVPTGGGALTMNASSTNNAAPTQATIDTTTSLTLDLQFKWGTANAANTIQFLGGWVAVMG